MVQEIFLDSKSHLVSKEKWEEIIASLMDKTGSDMLSKEDSIKELKKVIVDCTIERIPKGKKFGMMFSGGVDSTFLAMLLKQAGADFTCYTVGFKADDTKQPEDIDAAEEVAKLIGVKLKTKVYDVDECEELIEKTVKMLGKDLANVVNVGVASVVVACIDLAKKDGVEYLYSGLGSEEVFAGYERHRVSENIHDECWAGLFNMRDRDLLRDCLTAEKLKMNFLTPLMDERVIITAMRVPAKYKVDETNSKVILREVAIEMGLDKKFALRKKRAAQYGSRLDSALDKISRQNGFKTRKEYIASLL